MGIAAQPIFSHHSSGRPSLVIPTAPHYPTLNSMSQNYNPSIFDFPSGEFERSDDEEQQHVVQQHPVAQQIRRDRLRLQGFEPMVGTEEEDPANHPGYETAGMLYEMFNFPPGSGGTGGGTGELLLDHSIVAPVEFRAPQPPPPGVDGNCFWYSKSQSGPLDISCRNADSATAVKLFLMNPQTRSPSPAHQPPTPVSSNLHMLLPNPNESSSLHGLSISSIAAGGLSGGGGTTISTPLPLLPPPPPPQPFALGGGGSNSEIDGFIQSQGLSLSLSSSLQHLEAAKAGQLRNIGSDGLLFISQGANSSPASFIPQNSHKPGFVQSQNHPVHVGYGSPLAVVNVLRTSKYLKAAQELLDEFCSVGRGHFKKTKLHRSTNLNSTGPSSCSNNKNSGTGGVSSSSKPKENPPLSAADRIEHQRRKVKFLSMLDEVDRRYNQYCEQMQLVVTSFDLVMGFGSAVPYTALAQKAMSRHFRCPRDAVAVQLKHSCKLLGEKDATAGTSGVTKGETPRLKLLDRSFRRQGVLHDSGMLEQEAWRPQRGLPERSVTILRAWLFEHFLHPYPSDADKHLLALQTGLSRNQVANWFINARVRLWKPMVEEMYQQEAKDEEADRERDNYPSSSTITAAVHNLQNPAATNKRTEISTTENDPPVPSLSRHSSSETPLQSNYNSTHPSSSTAAAASSSSAAAATAEVAPTILPRLDPGHHQQRMLVKEASHPSGSFVPEYEASGDEDMAPALIEYGTSAGDVSLTLGLRHAGNLPEKNPFSVTHFGGC